MQMISTWKQECSPKIEHTVLVKRKVTYIDLISEGTIDERIVKTQGKIDIGAKVLGEEAREWLSLKPTKN